MLYRKVAVVLKLLVDELFSSEEREVTDKLPLNILAYDWLVANVRLAHMTNWVVPLSPLSRLRSCAFSKNVLEVVILF